VLNNPIIRVKMASSSSLVLFPNQLFEPALLKSMNLDVATIYFIEDPLFYGNRKGSGAVENLQLNQLRILYMYVSHHSYIQRLKSAGFKVIYKSIQDLWKKPMDYSFLPKQCRVFDPCDQLLLKHLPSHCVVLDSPSFILTAAEIHAYAPPSTPTKRLQHAAFYTFVKQKLQLLTNIPSQDKFNRAAYSKSLVEPPSPFKHLFSSALEWETGLHWLEKSPFAKNPAPSLPWKELIQTYLIHLPLTTDDVRLWLNDFIKERLDLYGKYQDVVIPTNPLLYHSGLSIYLNNGLITPLEVINAVRRKKTALQNYEGFVRQVIGWREYCRMYYLHVATSDYRKNIFHQTKTPKLSLEWYKGSTAVPIVNETIQYAFNYGYINHIQRLMIISNYMTLRNVHPDHVYRWMYEFSLDSYEWVMVFNCYSMGTWSDGGLAMRKPYISSANYILKMSKTPRTADWVTHWNALFHAFLTKHTDILKHTQLANLL